MGLLDNIVPDQVSSFIKGDELKGNGIKVKVAKMPEKVKADNPKYGFKEGPDMGMAIMFHFEMDGVPKTFNSASKRFIQAFNSSNVQVGEFLQIRKTGEMMDTQYFINVVGENDNVVPAPSEGEVALDEISFNE